MAEPGPSACRAGCASREEAAPSSLPTLPVPGAAAAAAAAGAPALRLDPSALRRGEVAAGATGTGQGGRKGGREGGREEGGEEGDGGAAAARPAERLPGTQKAHKVGERRGWTE